MTSLPRGTFAVALVATAVLASTGGAAVAAKVITGADIKNGTITSSDVKDRSLTTKDLSASTVRGLKGARGPAGPAGASGYTIVQAGADVTAGEFGTVTVSCPAGKVVTGASAFWVASFDGAGITYADLDAENFGTSASAYANPVATDDTLVITASCITGTVPARAAKGNALTKLAP